MTGHRRAGELECPVCSTPVRPLGGRGHGGTGTSLYRCPACGHVLKSPSKEAAARLAEGADRPKRPESTRWLFQHLPRGLVDEPGLAVLDVGCWEGDHLAALPHTALRRGIEPNANAAIRAQARGLDVEQGFIEDVELERSTYDLITAMDVVEHLPRPRETLVRLADALKPGGSLVVLTGNAGSSAGRLWGYHWYYLHYPEHISVFTRASLEMSIRATGLVPATIVAVAHPTASVRGDFANAARHIVSRSELHGDVSLRPRVGANRLTLSRLVRGRDHLLALATKP
jgi:SAM-dependent methyltransferase